MALGAAVFAGERPDPMGVIGIMLVSGGIISLAFQGRKLGFGILPYDLATGWFIGVYSVTDGVGVRFSGAPIGYTIWMSLLGSLLTPTVFLIARRGRGLIGGRRETLSAASGGIVSLVAYGIVIFAMSFGPMGPVSALRETSVVFAALIGWLYLKERMTRHRIIACCVITAEALCIGHDSTHRTAHPSQFIPQPSRPVADR